MAKTLTLSSDRATLALGQWLGQTLPAGSILLLQGDLGSGKTTLTKGIGLGLGITEEIDSPTFTLINEYVSGRVPLYHVDLYRLEPAAAQQLYLESYWEGVEYPPGIVAIEWAERLPSAPPQALAIALAHQPTGRTVTLAATHLPYVSLLEGLNPDAILAHEI